jgi:hypothetical protein
MSLDVEAAVGVALGIGEQQRPGPRPQRLGDRTSRPVTVIASYQTPNPAFTYGFLRFPPVSPNKIWEILRIGVTGSDPFTTLAGVSVLAYRSGYAPQDSNTEPTSFGDLIAVLGTVPNTSYPSWRSTVARQAEIVILAFKGLTAGQQIQASMDVIEHDLELYLKALIS